MTINKRIETLVKTTFLNHFVFCLVLAVLAWIAYLKGVPQLIYVNDASHMTSLIAAAFIGIASWLGYQAWFIDDATSKLGHLGERLLPMIGLFGTAFGLSLQAQSLVGGAAAFGPLATSLYCTAAGVLGAAILAVMTFNLDHGIEKAQK